MHPLRLLVLLVVAFGAMVAVAQKENCDKNELDTCSLRLLMLGDRQFKFPIEMSAMNKRCKDLKRLENCVKDNSKLCLQSSSKQSISVLTYGIARTNRGYCSSTKRKNSFIAFGQCVNDNLSILASFMDDLNRDFHATLGYSEKKGRIPMVCCNYYRFKERVLDHINTKCPEHATEIENLIDGYARDILNLLCGDYTEDSDKCKSLVTKTPKYSKKLKWKAIVMPIVDVLDSLE